MYCAMLFRQRSCKRQAPHPGGPTYYTKDSAFYNNTKTEKVRPAEYKQEEEETI